jgi:PEP-CTERM motif
MRLLVKLICLAAVVAAPLAARADSVATFTFDVLGQTLTWVLPIDPTPDFSDPHFFVMDNVPVIYDGVATTADIEFASSLIGGGLSVNIGNQNPYFDAQGLQLFSGSTSSPVFLLSPTPFVLQSEGLPASITITPEPSTLLLLGSGVFGLAGVARRKRFFAWWCRRTGCSET